MLKLNSKTFIHAAQF